MIYIKIDDMFMHPNLLLLFGKHFGASGHEHCGPGIPATPERGAHRQEASFAMRHSSPKPQMSVCKKRKMVHFCVEIKGSQLILPFELLLSK